MDNFDTDEITRTLADTNGAPQRILRNQDQISEMRQSRQQQEQMQSMIASAPAAAQAAQAAQTVSEIAAEGQLGPSQ